MLTATLFTLRTCTTYSVLGPLLNTYAKCIFSTSTTRTANLRVIIGYVLFLFSTTLTLNGFRFQYYQIQFQSANVLWQSDEPACPRIQPDVPVEFAAFIANQAPQIASSRVAELQTYAQKKRAVARMRTSQVSPPSKAQSAKVRNTTVSKKAKGKKKANQDDDNEKNMACD